VLDLALGREVVAADEREPSELDLDPGGDDRGHDSDERDRRDLHLFVVDQRLPKVEIGCAEEAEGEHAAGHAPRATPLYRADDRHEPGPALSRSGDDRRSG
jgi:hypothetical protein